MRRTPDRLRPGDLGRLVSPTGESYWGPLCYVCPPCRRDAKRPDPGTLVTVLSVADGWVCFLTLGACPVLFTRINNVEVLLSSDASA